MGRGRSVPPPPRAPGRATTVTESRFRLDSACREERRFCYNPHLLNFDCSKTRGKEPAMENVDQRVKKIVAEQLGVNEAEIKSGSSFVDDLGADSLDTVELVMALEEEFETEIPDEDAEKITTVQQAITYISSHLGKK